LISQGAKRDLLIIQFCKALLVIANTEETITDSDVMSRNNTQYHLNKKIDRALNKIIDRLQNTIDTLYLEGKADLSKWIVNNLEPRIGVALTKIQVKTVNLEMLALWILFVNFSEKDRKLHQAFIEWVDANQYFKVLEMMCNTKIAVLEGELFQTSYEIMEYIKR